MWHRGGGRGPEPTAARRLAAFLWGIGALMVVVSAFITADPRPSRTLPEQWLLDALAPVQGAVGRAGRTVSDTLASLARLGRVQQENELLRRELDEARLQLSLLAGVAEENRQLRRALQLPQVPGYRLVAAEVIQRRPSRWYAQVLLNRGRADGLAPLAPVVAPGGLVGQVVQVSQSTATVSLLSDVESAVGGLVVRTGDLVLVQGLDRGAELRVKSLTPQSSFEPGDVVVSSGLGGVYPRGVLVGTIRSVWELPGGLGREGRLLAGADLDRLGVLFVLVEEAARK